MMKRLLGGNLPAGAPALAAAPAPRASPTTPSTASSASWWATSAAAPAPAPAAGCRTTPPRRCCATCCAIRRGATSNAPGARSTASCASWTWPTARCASSCSIAAPTNCWPTSAPPPATRRAPRSTPVLKGDGRGCDIVVSLEEFGPGLAELSLLGGLAAVATAQGAVLLAGAAPALAAVATSEDAQVLASNESRVWRALRESALAPHVGLTFPRLLARLPYGPRNDPGGGLRVRRTRRRAGRRRCTTSWCGAARRSTRPAAGAGPRAGRRRDAGADGRPAGLHRPQRRRAAPAGGGRGLSGRARGRACCRRPA